MSFVIDASTFTLATLAGGGIGIGVGFLYDKFLRGINTIVALFCGVGGAVLSLILLTNMSLRLQIQSVVSGYLSIEVLLLATVMILSAIFSRGKGKGLSRSIDRWLTKKREGDKQE